MGLFKKNDTTIVHPDVRRTIHVPAAVDAVIGQLEAYSELHSPKHAASVLMRVASGDGWTAVHLPPAMHPWTFHNVAFWLLDTPGAGAGLLAQSAGSPHHPAYVLEKDPDIDDGLCGWDDNGDGWSVLVPTNDIVRGEAVPVDLPDVPPVGGTEWESVEVLVEDPGTHMNPTASSNVKNRDALKRRHSVGIF